MDVNKIALLVEVDLDYVGELYCLYYLFLLQIYVYCINFPIVFNLHKLFSLP